MGFLSKLFSGKNSNMETASRPMAEIETTKKELISENQLLKVHPDIRDFLWIGDGPKKNYSNRAPESRSTTINGITISFSFGTSEEPSLLYTKMPIASKAVPSERPPYYPTYRELTPSQKGVYWKLLANPYDNTIDIGYVFILYYGLERFLLTDRYEEVIDIIIKLRDVHTNKSFQAYSANAVILICLYYQRADIVSKFMKSLDKDYEFEFSDNLFLLCKYSMNLTLNAKETMRLAKSFEFNNTNYIKKYPDMFEQTLTNQIENKYGTKDIQCANLITKAEFKKLPMQKVEIFSNLSIQDKSIEVPLIVTSFHFKKDVYDLLVQTHETVKATLAKMRKSGDIIPEKAPLKNKGNKELPSFDISQEKALLSEYKKQKNTLFKQHFASIALQDFYYKYRDLDEKYMELCIQYCEDDILKLEAIQASYREEERRNYLKYLSSSEVEKELVNLEPFTGIIPAFKRMAIIYEKRKQFDKAIDMCNQAIQYYSTIGNNSAASDFVERKENNIIKLEKINR